MLQRCLAAFDERVPTTLTSRYNVALILAARGDSAASEAEAPATLTLQREALGENHSATLTTWQTLANVLVPQQEFDEAKTTARTSIRLRARNG